MIQQFLGKGIFQDLVGKQHPSCGLVCHINGTAHVVQNLLQCCVGTGQGILLDPSGEDALQDLHCIRCELDLRHAPHMPLGSMIQRQHHISALLLQDREDHHGLHADLLDFLRAGIAQAVRGYHQWFLSIKEGIYFHSVYLVKIRNLSRGTPFTDHVHGICVGMQLKNIRSIYTDML